MSIIRNRELSQFGSFVFIDNDSQNISITFDALPYVGIGTTSPQYKLDVVGDTRVQGNFEALSYTLNGIPLVDATIQYWTFGTGGDDIYRLQGNVGIGTSVFVEKLTVDGSVSIDGNISVSGDITNSGDTTIGGNITASRFISTVTTGTAPFEVDSLTLVTHLNADYLRGKTPPTGDIVGTTDTQTLSNKTISLSNNTLTGTATQFNAAVTDTDFATLTGTETLTNKTLTTPIISGIRPSSGQLQTVPTGTGTLVSSNSVGVVTTGMIADETIVNADISASAAIAISKLAASTISGISLGNSLNNLTAGSFITYNSGSTYNGSTAITIGVAGTTANTANTLIARNSSGDFSAGTITGAAFNATATDAFRISGTTLINSSRNIINAVNGTFSGTVTADTFSGTTGSFIGTVTADTFSGNGTIPVGGIIMWSGSIVSIPSGWSLCDGSNGTPDLKNRFIVGAGDLYSVAGIGGTTDSVVVAHTHAYTYRGTEVVPGLLGSETVASDATITGITSSTGESGANKNLPPYYALAFIMRTL
jgi:cytoskeletal protein CcmA (bactofilin family)